MRDDGGYLGEATFRIELRCAECGEKLRMKGGKAQLGPAHNALEFGPVRTFHIVPCEHCIEKHVGPAKRLAAAIADLS